MLEALGHPTELIDAEENKYSILCPWHEEHSENGKTGSSTVVWQRPDRWPKFKCLHAHCTERGLETLLTWAEGKQAGIVDRFCEKSGVYDPAAIDEKGRPQVLHPGMGRLITEVYEELIAAIRPAYTWFKRSIEIVTTNKIPSGFIYSGNEDTEYKVKAHITGFCNLNAQDAKSRVEKHVIPGKLVGDGRGNVEFRAASFSTDFCNGLVSASEFCNGLPEILRILTVPIPIRVGNRLVFPCTGYDPRFGTFLIPDAPILEEMPLDEALKILESIHAEFPFTNEQSRTHALARLLMPFARGLLGWTTRVPLWFYFANRPRAGKDYLAAVPLLVYEGYAFEDLPIGRDSEETRKRLIAAARSGRRFMHFSNCQGYLQDSNFYQVITATGISARNLGATEASSDLTLPNEMEFSISANVGLTYREDFEGRIRKIELAYFQEDANSREFKDPFLHQTIKDNRALILSAIAAVYRNWASKGFPVGPTAFTSFAEWAHIVGGVMVAAGLGDPCLPFRGEYDNAGGNQQAEAMTELFRVCHAEFGDKKVLKKEIYKCAQAAMDGGNDALSYFGDLENAEDARANQTKLGIKLTRFKNRELAGIKLLMEDNVNASRNQYRFVKVEGSDAPEPDKNAPEKCQPVKLCQPLASQRGKHLGFDNKKESIKKEEKKEGIYREVSANVDNVDRLTSLEGAPTNLSSATLGIDIETYSELMATKRGKILNKKDPLNPRKGEIRLLSISDPEGGISVGDLRKKPLSNEEREILESRELIAHNAAFELRLLGTKYGIVPRQVFCTMTASKLLLPGRVHAHNLKAVIERHLGVDIPKELGTSHWGGFVLTEEQMEYARNDVRYLHQLKDKLAKELEAAGLTKVFEMERRLLLVTAAMEVHGFSVNIEAMRALKEEADRISGDLAVELRKDFKDEQLNPGSNPQLLRALKQEGANVENADEETLRALDDPRAQTILRWRAEAKLSSNIETLLKAGHQARIYSRFNPLGTVTGRFSSKSPNLQNITRGPLRSAFIPSGPDRRLIVADYSQIELRVAALVAKESGMISAFKTKADLHKMTAAAVLQKPIEEVTKADRQMAKAVSFGFLYGQSAKGFVTYARTTYGLNLSLEDAERFRENFFSTHYGFRRWHIECRRKSVSPGNGSARTVFGRLLVAKKNDAWARFNLHTEYVVSGSCADLIKVAMIKISSVMPSDVHLVATVHDELIYDVPVDMAEQYRGVIRQTMIEAFVEMFRTEVPVEVEAKVCANWGEK